MADLKLLDLFAKSKHACRELLWDAGLIELTIAGSEKQEAFLPGRSKGEMAPVLCFKEPRMKPIVLSSGRGKFLLRTLGRPDAWPGNVIGVYVDREMDTRAGKGSIQFAIGPDYWAAGHYSGKAPPPQLASKRNSRTQPRPSEPHNEPPCDPTPEACQPYVPDREPEPEREPGEEG